MNRISVNIVDVVAERIFYGELTFADGRITHITETGSECSGASYLMPGFVDAHIHIESSLLTPDEFARAALEKGTLGCVSDPHEIANVLGLDGIRFMQQRAALTPFKILFGAPSCVPATPFESAGATLDATAISNLLTDGTCGYLSEVMNFPGVLNNVPDVMQKIAAARSAGVPLDGHAPGLTGALAQRYARAGISTDHECTTLAEARDKLAAGMSILIREGSAAQDFNALHPLFATHSDRIMLCSDDKHPDDLLEGHIRELVQRALALGYPLFHVLRAATLNPVRHYGLSLGLLQTGDPMDALLVNNLQEFKIQQAWLNGKPVVEDEHCLLPQQPAQMLNRFAAQPVSADQLQLEHPGVPCRVITAQDGKLLTGRRITTVPRDSANDKLIAADLNHDVLFIAVVNRYQNAPPAVALIHGFGLQQGAIASSVAHDSHNIVAVGTSPQWLASAINCVIEQQGALAAVDAHGTQVLPLPIAGLMSALPAQLTGPAYRQLNQKAHQMGSPLRAPFMTLSFMALLVIPELKLSDKGLFDGNRFEFCTLAASAEEIEAATQRNGVNP